MTKSIIALIAVLLLIGCLTAAYVAGYAQGTSKGKADVATLTASYAHAQAIAEVAARQRLQAVQARGDTLSQELLQSESTRVTKTQELQGAIKKLTTGRRCLYGNVVRLLNGTERGNGSPDHMLAASGSTDAEDGAVAPDSDVVATDTDVASWAENARAKYETCRGRLAALIDWGNSK